MLRDGAPGVSYLSADQALLPYPDRITDRLVHWARERPDQTLFAQRVKLADGSKGDWRHISFAQALDAARRIAQGLLDRGLSAERPVLILSENDLEHALLALGCLIAGIAYCPTSPAYSLISQDFDKLRHVVKTLTPGLVFASEASRYSRAMLATLDDSVELVTTSGSVPGRATTSFAALLATEPTPAVDAAMAATGPDTIAKFLFTSGSTKMPKAVINTQRMWCANQQQMTQSMPVLTDGPLVLVDWLPVEPHLRWQPQFRHGAVSSAARCTSTKASPRQP